MDIDMRIETRSGVVVLAPSDGMKLTDGKVVADGEVWLGKFSKPGDWREIGEAEAQAMKQAAEETSL